MAIRRPQIDSPPALGNDEMRFLFEHISDAVFATDTANRFTHWTASAERLFGYTPPEALGRTFKELLTYSSTQDNAGDISAALAVGRTWHGTGRVRVRGGAEIWIESRVEPIIADGRLLGSVSVARDVTAMIQTQQRLIDEQQFVAAVLSATEALVIVLDLHGQVVRLNAACERLSGYPAAEILGRPIWTVLFPPNEAAGVRAEFDNLRAGAFPRSYESHWLTADGELRPIAWKSTCLTDAAGLVTHVIATGIDITERKNAEEALEHGASLMKALMESLPAHVYFKDRDSRFIMVSNSEAAALGLDDPGGAIGKTDFDFFTDEHAHQAYADEQEIIRTGQAHITEEKETRAILPDTWVATTKLPLRDTEEKIIGTFGISVDVTEARKEQEALQNQARGFAALAEFAAAANAIHKFEPLVSILADAVNAILPTDTAVITILDRSDGAYRVRAARGLASGAVGAIIEPGSGTAGLAISERVVIVKEHDDYGAALRDYRLYDTSWALGVPLLNEDTVLGAISVGRVERAAAFTPSEIEIFGLLGAHAALGLANASLTEEVSALAIHDGLTGLFNRRYFDSALDLAIARSVRRAPEGQLAAIMFDLDHFGDFNERHGHLGGDALLRGFAEILQKSLRATDIVARYGGEEFVAILEDCDLAEATRLAERVRQGLEQACGLGVGSQAIRAHVSAGCAVLDPATPTAESLIGRADAALYAAKRHGRNRVVADGAA